MGEVKKLKSLPVFEFSLIIAVIWALISFILGIIYFIVGYAAVHQASTFIISLNNNTTAVVNSVASSINGGIVSNYRMAYYDIFPDFYRGRNSSFTLQLFSTQNWWY